MHKITRRVEPKYQKTKIDTFKLVEILECEKVAEKYKALVCLEDYINSHLVQDILPENSEEFESMLKRIRDMEENDKVLKLIDRTIINAFENTFVLQNSISLMNYITRNKVAEKDVSIVLKKFEQLADEFNLEIERENGIGHISCLGMNGFYYKGNSLESFINTDKSSLEIVLIALNILFTRTGVVNKDMKYYPLIETTVNSYLSQLNYYYGSDESYTIMNFDLDDSSSVDFLIASTCERLKELFPVQYKLIEEYDGVFTCHRLFFDNKVKVEDIIRGIQTEF